MAFRKPHWVKPGDTWQKRWCKRGVWIGKLEIWEGKIGKWHTHGICRTVVDDDDHFIENWECTYTIFHPRDDEDDEQ